jgi:N-dimethylarginine dimethylaminohydrolase
MDEYAGKAYDYDVAFEQFQTLYSWLSRESIVYLLPSKGNFQDQVFVANLGCYLPHITDKETILLSNFKSPPRIGEEIVGLDFFESMGYNVIRPSSKFEGEADLKYMRDNLYIGGYGIRTDIRTHYWLAEKTGADVISVEMTDEELYHFDCMFFPLTDKKALAVTSAMKREDVRKLEKVVELVAIPPQFMYNSWTNSLKFGNKILYSPTSHENIEDFLKFVPSIGYEPVLIRLNEFEKSGAGLSCMVLHLNHNGRMYEG